MIEVEVLGTDRAPGAPPVSEITRLCELAAEAAGLADGHLAIEFVDARRITELNAEYRQRPQPTDVLSFPIDGVEPIAPTLPPAERALLARAHIPRELGDIVICPEHTADLREAIVHGMLHLLGMDHETDDGEMLEVQRELLARAAR
jgi:probable rRNA maturation factor